jgi:hypothetical protein
VPYRDSKLTRVLRDSLLDKKCLILMIVTLNPCIGNYDETFNSLAFANKIKSLKVEVKDRLNIYKPPRVARLKKQTLKISSLEDIQSSLKDMKRNMLV